MDKKAMDEFKKEYQRERDEVTDLTDGLVKLIKESGLDKKSYGLNLSKVLGNLFDTFDNVSPDGKIKHSFDGSTLTSALERYRCKRITMDLPKIKALYQYLVENEHTLDNRFDVGFGDRHMYYIPNKDKKIIHFENQNIKCVAVIDGGFREGIHIRKVYSMIESDPDYGWYSMDEDGVDLDGFRERIKEKDGLEFAIANLTSNYQNSQYSDCYPGVKYPSRISLENMIEHNFGDKSPAFSYGDNRDECYVLSLDTMMGKAESVTGDAKYIWEELLTGVSAVNDDEDGEHGSKGFIDNYIKTQKRSESIEDILSKRLNY
jgi:hypothetical protein